MIETVNEHCRHEDCKYRGKLHVDAACLYMLYTGRPRGCAISECNRYSPGKIKKILTLDGVVYKGDDL